MLNFIISFMAIYVETLCNYVINYIATCTGITFVATLPSWVPKVREWHNAYASWIVSSGAIMYYPDSKVEVWWKAGYAACVMINILTFFLAWLETPNSQKLNTRTYTYDYLINTFSSCTRRAKESLDGYNFSIQVWVSNIRILTLGEVSLLLADVKHSQKLTAAPLSTPG